MEFKGTKGEWTYSRQIGIPGHCTCAQLWDGDGKKLAVINTIESEEEASSNPSIFIG